MTRADDAARWARERGIPLLLGAELPTVRDIRLNPSVDFGGLVTRVPAFVLQPRATGELAACVAFLRTLELPWVARGTGHSSGGRVLVPEGGAVIDLRHLARVVADGGATITVEAGTWWLAVLEHLARDGRRPAVLTDNLRSSVGGTLAAGGVGEASHLEGLQIDAVVGLTVVTPDGAVHRVGPGDELFRYSLAGHGQLGVIAEATLTTRRRPPFLAARTLLYPDLPAYVAAVAEHGHGHAFVRGRILWRPGTAGNPVRAVIGSFSADLADAPPPDLGGAVAASKPKVLDLLERARNPRTPWPAFAPCAEIALPLPGGLAMWASLDEELRAAGLPSFLERGSSAVVLAPGARLPLAPFPPGAERALLVALRPGLEDEAVARRVAAWLRGFSGRAVAAGARLYLVGEEPADPGWLARNYGDALPAWRALKQRLDPGGWCHPFWA